MTVPQASGDPLTRVRQVCLALPEAFEQEAWGEPTFRVNKKMFAMFANNHHNDGRVALWCNAPPGTQQILVQAEPEKFFVPPYVGVKGWVGIVVDKVEDVELREIVVDAYCIAASRRLQGLVRSS